MLNACDDNVASIDCIYLPSHLLHEYIYDEHDLYLKRIFSKIQGL